MQNEPPVIDQQPQERLSGGPAIWWVAWAIVALGWIWYFNYRPFDIDALALGGLTGMILALWGIEMSGNKLPSWMVPPPKSKKT